LLKRNPPRTIRRLRLMHRSPLLHWSTDGTSLLATIRWECCSSYRGAGSRVSLSLDF
jgi:hypothetical protein